MCAGEHQQQLKDAKCSESDIEDFCLPPCPLTNDPDDYMFPFIYNPNCEFDYGNNISKTYMMTRYHLYINIHIMLLLTCKIIIHIHIKCWSSRFTRPDFLPSCF